MGITRRTVGLFLAILGTLLFLCLLRQHVDGFQDGIHNSDKKTIVVYELTDGAGFFSTFWIMCKFYLYAKEHNYPFFVETSELWPYKYRLGWHDYFKSLKQFNKDDHGSDTQILKFNRSNMDNDPDYTIGQYKDVAVKELFVLNDNLQAIVNEHVKKYGIYKSLYIRRGDKSLEATVLTIPQILEQVPLKDDGSSIFVQTDDYNAVEELTRLFPSCKIHTYTSNYSNGADYHEILQKSEEGKKAHAEELLISVGIYLGCVEGWTNIFSNVGVFHKLAGYDKVNVYIDPTYSRESVDAQLAIDNIIRPFYFVEKFTKK